jgi:nucleoside-diphosphate-sugar epimerase
VGASGGLLVTGATGFVGRALLEQGSEREWVALTRSGVPDWSRELSNVEWVEADLTDPDFDQALPSEIHAVLHLARSRHHREFPERASDIYAVDLGSTARLLSYAQRSGAERFLLASTATVYAPSSEPLDEDAPLGPGRLFAACKRGSELLLRAYAAEVPSVALRLFAAYGPGQRRALIGELIERVRAGEPIQVQGERGLLLSPIYVEDVVAAVLAALELPLPEEGPETINVGGPDSLGIREIGEAIGEALGTEPRFEAVDGPEHGGYLADRSKARRLLGMPEPISFREGLRRTIDAAASAPR